MMSLSNRTAVVTGSSEGIGLAVADCMTAAGDAVVLVARDEERLGRAAGTLRRDGRSVTAVAGDITDPHVRQRAVKVCLERYGSVDVLVNNAGMQGPIGPMIEASEDQLHQVLAMNLVSPLLMVREVYEGWMREHGGVVVNITSFSGLRPQVKYGPYGGAKAALEHQTRVLAAELAPQVRVNSIAPGLIMTRMALAGTSEEYRRKAAARRPLRRLGDPEDVAKAALFLCTDASSWITGIVIPVDGGALVSS